MLTSSASPKIKGVSYKLVRDERAFFFPGLREVTHLNWGNQGLPSSIVSDAELRQAKNHVSGRYETWEESAGWFRDPQLSIARHINAQVDEVHITAGGTAGLQLALSAILPPREEPSQWYVLLDKTMYTSGTAAIIRRFDLNGASTPYKILHMPADRHGRLLPRELEAKLDEMDRNGCNIDCAVATALATVGGPLQPIGEIGEILRDRKIPIPYLVDGVQALGHFPVNIRNWNCDFAAFAFQKFVCGPEGTGFLFVNHDFVDSPRYFWPHTTDVNSVQVTYDKIHGYQMRRYAHPAADFERWSSSKTLKAGLAEGIYHLSNVGVSQTWERIQSLASYLRSKLEQDPERFKIWSKDTTGIVSFNIMEKNSAWHETVKTILRQEYKIHVDAYDRSICPGWEGMPALLRVSIHWVNTTEDLDNFLYYLNEIITNPQNYAHYFSDQTRCSKIPHVEERAAEELFRIGEQKTEGEDAPFAQG